MITNLGDFVAGSTIYVPFHTFNSSGASVTLTGLAVTDIEIYKNGSVTQRASDAGCALLDTDGIDFDGVTGIHGFSIDTSNNTDSGFYSSGAVYWVVVSAVTVDTQTVSFVAAIFSIENTTALRPTTAGRTLDVASTGEAGVDFGNIAMPASGPVYPFGIYESGTAQSVTATTLVGRAAATNDIVKAGMILWAYGSTQGYWQSVMLDSVSGDTFTIAAWPTATPSGTITYVVFGTPTASVSLPVPANLVQLVNDAQSATDLKDFADAGYDPATNKVQGVVLTDTVTTYTGNTPQTGDSYARIGAPTGASISADVAAVKSDTAATLVDTNELQTDWTNGGRLDLLLDATLADTNELQTDWVNGGRLDLILDATATASALATVDAIADTLVAGVITGAAATGTLSTTQATSNLTGYANDQLIGRVIIWLTGNCEGEATDITDYASASGLLTFTALTTAPGNGDTFKIV